VRFNKTDGRAAAAGRLGGSKRAPGAKGEAIDRIMVLYPGANRDAVVAGYDVGYNSGAGSKYQPQRRTTRTT
jgi:hypothetical protein